MATKLTQNPLYAAHASCVERYLAPARQGMARNVVGVGIGYKNGKPAAGLAIRYFVERKLADPSAIAAQHLLADPTGSATIDVEETGRLSGFHKVGPGGTLGLLLRAPNINPMAMGSLAGVVVKGKRAYLLASNHALAFNGRVPTGTALFSRDFGEFVTGAEPVVARLSQTVVLDRRTDNQVDCALAEITAPDSVRIGDPVEPIDVAEQGRVYKETDRGSATGHVTDTHATVEVDFTFGTFRFSDVLLIQGKKGRFASPGDSGALIFDEATKRPAAMIIGGSDTHIAACKLTTVMSVLGGKLHVGRR